VLLRPAQRERERRPPVLQLEQLPLPVLLLLASSFLLASSLPLASESLPVLQALQRASVPLRELQEQQPEALPLACLQDQLRAEQSPQQVPIQLPRQAALLPHLFQLKTALFQDPEGSWFSQILLTLWPFVFQRPKREGEVNHVA